MKNINICIIYYNTPFLTDCLIKSINKFVKKCNIYIFDNSDKFPFINVYNNVTIFDNTKQKYINFDKWLEKYPNRFKSTEKTHTFGSAKHCYSVQKCIELINDNFILIDSDVLLKKDITDIIKENYVFVGEINKQNYVDIYRVLPFLCYINVNMCKKYNVPYFDDNYMHGLYNNSIISDADYYDTGAGFFIHAKNYPYYEIEISEYIEHYKRGSWNSNDNKLTNEEWLLKYYNLWGCYNKKNQNKIAVYTCITGGYDTLIESNFISKNVDYICFTDNVNLTSKTWEIRQIPKEILNSTLSNVKKQRWIKINAHKILNKYEKSIWVDANIEIKQDVSILINKCLKDNVCVAIPSHPQRNSIFDEANVCKLIKKDKDEIIDKQINEYKKKEYKADNGLVQTNIILRNHNDNNCKKLMETWWNEVKTHSHRDQLSFNYALWKTNTIEFFRYMPSSTCNSDYFHWNVYHQKQIEVFKPNTNNKAKKSNIPIRKYKPYKPIKIMIGNYK